MRNIVKGLICFVVLIVIPFYFATDKSQAQKAQPTAQQEPAQVAPGQKPAATKYQHKDAAKGLTNQDCQSCHDNKELYKEVDGKQVFLFLDEPLYNESVHKSLNCIDCHSDVTGDPHEPTLKKVSCGDCHEPAAQQALTSIHSKTRVGDQPAAKCIDCHGTHYTYPSSDVRSMTNHLKIPETCSKCHTDQAVIQKYSLASAQIINNYRDSVHGKGVFSSGLVVSAVCSDCHGNHDIRGKNDPQGMLSRANLPNTCSNCHQGILADFEKSAHGELWKKGDDKAPNCATCHKSHEIKPTAAAAFQLQMTNQCGECHKEQSHTYRDTFHGQATSLGLVVAAKCSDCHTPHMNLPKENPLSTVASANLNKTCGQCHADMNAKFLSYDPHPNPTDKNASPLLYYVYTFMKWLLISVFGFFGLHTLLWAQRSVVAWLRGEVHKDTDGGPYITRFATSDRLTHLAMVLSFMGLALTGLPLIFHYTPWGQRLSTLMGGIEVSRYFHRFWAVITFGYAAYHLGLLLKRLIIKRDLSLFSGPNSMVPRKQDVLDFVNNVKWFLYLGKRPKLDRWTYWEKFDYYAVFWGVPIIGLSGLLLWMPWLFTKFMPGSMLNVAKIVHGEEALLAVGFIFTFHFFHNHLRPENFPLDTVIFTGKLPLSKFKEERQQEYDRLVKEGKLEALLTDPPSEALQRAASWFGITALVIGLMLAGAIFTSYFLYRF
jgi:cytochrome b subunit of formate dehydrogenase/nitrate/TMAO reductase-like tetraheme cytochrome c subunit